MKTSSTRIQSCSGITGVSLLSLLLVTASDAFIAAAPVSVVSPGAGGGTRPDGRFSHRHERKSETQRFSATFEDSSAPVAAAAAPTIRITTPIFGKHYQLEQLELGDSVLTEVFLSECGKVDFGETDGPRYKEASGEWEQRDGVGSDGGQQQHQQQQQLHQGFAMSMKQIFEGGSKEKDIGLFTFPVERWFVGELTKVGAKLAMSGRILCKDVLGGEQEVGYFTMIDTTAERFGNQDE